MKPIPALQVLMCAVTALAAFNTSAPAQLAASGTPGDRAVSTVDFALALGSGLGSSQIHDFDFIEFDDIADSFDHGVDGEADDTKIFLTEGHHLVLYGLEYTNTANGRGAVESTILLNEFDIPYGASAGYFRDNGTDDLFSRGGTILEVSQGDSIEISSARTDNHSQDLNFVNGDIQLVKLDDSLDFLRLGLDGNAQIMSASQAGPQPVNFTLQDELDAGSFAHDTVTNPNQITLKTPGHYLVFANTGCLIAGSNRHRNVITQELYLTTGAGTSPVGDSATTVYLRHASPTDGAGGLVDVGATSLGMIVETSEANSILEVRLERDSLVASTNTTVTATANRTGLTILKLPAYGDYITLSGGAQDINTGASAPLSFAASSNVANGSFTYDSGVSASQIFTNKAADYLVLSSGYVANQNLAGTDIRAMPRLRFEMTPSGGFPTELFWGEGGAYHRDKVGGGDQALDSGAWAGAIVAMEPGDAVEAVSGQYGDPGVTTARSVGFQALNIASISSAPLIPVVGVNSSLNLVVGTSGSIAAEANLLTTDADNGPAELTYTVTGAITGGTLKRIGVALAPSATFTQEDINNGFLTFDAGGAEETGGFDFSVSDGTTPALGRFTVQVGIATVVSDDTGATDEDTAISTVDPGGAEPSLLANDVGTGLTLGSFEATSAQGAAVAVSPDGTFSYDPTSSSALNALAIGEQVVDTFTYTVIDFMGVANVGTVEITVDGVNAAPSVGAESVSNQNGAGANAQLLANDSDIDASDVLRVTNITQQVFGHGGAVVDQTFNFQSVPFVFTTELGAKVSVGSDGTFSYDVSGAPTLLNLNPGVMITETFDYVVSDGTADVPTTLSITSFGSNLPTGDYGSTDADNTVNLDVLGNDQVRNNPGSLGTPTGGAVLEFLADTPANTSGQWFNTGSASVNSIPEGGPSDATLNAAILNPPPGFSAAYNFAGAEGITHLDVEQGSYGDSDAVNSSIECVFRPSDQVGSEVVWEVGGTTDGSSLTIVGDKVVWTSVDNGNLIAQAVGQLPAGAVAGGEFVHVVAKIDLSSDTAEIYVNGQLAGTGTGVNTSTGAPGNLADWCGTDDGGIGRVQTDIGGNIGALGAFGTFDLGPLGDFRGEVAILRTYESLLTPSQISANFDAVFGASAPAVVGDLTDLAGAGVPTVGVPVALPSGATVTMENDGTFTYDPNGAFAHVGVGLTERDSFTYSLNTGSSSEVTVNVDVAGTNGDPQVTIAAVQGSVLEGAVAPFTISSSAAVSGPVDVTVGFSGLSQHGDDFTGSATVQIADGAMSTPLVLTVLDDNLFEGLENMVVTIEAVSGNAVIGATDAAETLLNDAQGAPEFSLAADSASVQEGSLAGFTITPSVPSQADRSVEVAYSGTATNGADFLGLTTVSIPGGDADVTLNLLAIDDAVVEGAETVTVTVTSVDTGTIGASDEASTEITDGSAVELFQADFENVDPFLTPGGTVTGADAPAAADLGTAIGSWEGVPTGTTSGDQPGLHPEIDDVKGDGVDTALVMDRPLPGMSEITARLQAPADFSGDSSALIAMDLGNRRTQNNTEDKSWRIIGLDDAGEKSFELEVDGNNNGPNHERLLHVDSEGVRTGLGNVSDFENTLSTERESAQTRLIISLSADGFQVGLDRWPIDGVIDVVTGTLSYAGPATQVSGIRFSLNASVVDVESSGMIVDDVNVAGIAGNVAPSATFEGNPIANGGSTVIPNGTIGTQTPLGTFEVDDPDAGAGVVTATLQSTGAAPLTFDAPGPATVTGSGTGTLMVSGTMADVNTSLAGATVSTDAATGGDAVISFTIDDGGNTGPGGAKAISHDLTFFVNEGPTVTIDLSDGQATLTSTEPIEFAVEFSENVTGFDGGDVDLSASTAPGPLVASVTGGPSAYTVSVTGMSGRGTVTISLAKGAGTGSPSGQPSEASTALADTVSFIAAVAPTATNLVQVIEYENGPVDIGDIVVRDGNDSVVSSAQAPQYDLAQHGDSLNLTPDPATDAGFAIELVVTPTGFDDFGTVRVFEIGGTSNGTGIYLIDGVPHFVSKMNTVPDSLPSGLNDTDWADGNICIPLSGDVLTADVPIQIALISSLDAVTFSVNGQGQTTVPLTGRDAATRNNWSGDDTIRVGQNGDGGRGGLGNDPAGTFDDAGAFPMEGTVSAARLWHAPDASGFSIDALDAAEEVTATLSFPAGSGDLSEPAGVTYDAGAGTWSITGTVPAVNAALAEVQFLPNGTSPVVIDVAIDDGDEDGSGPLMGSLTLTLPSNDTDGDGLPDDYELAHGLDPNNPDDARTDGDRDGWDSLSEFLMGTSASDGSAVPVFEINYVSATQVDITYGPILTGRTYDVLVSTDGENFTVLDSNTAGADEATNTATDATGDAGAEIYKLEVTIPE